MQEDMLVDIQWPKSFNNNMKKKIVFKINIDLPLIEDDDDQ